MQAAGIRNNAELAEALGVGVGAVNSLLGKHNQPGSFPRLVLIERYAEALGVPVSDLTGEDGSEP
jgi:transcriptional regulator with XRE-family HTH domain